MNILGFIGGVVEAIGPAIAKTAGEFLVGGPSGQQQTPRPAQLQSKIAGDLASTSRVSRPDTPGIPGVADVDALHAEWIARMNKFASLASLAKTGTTREHLASKARRT